MECLIFKKKICKIRPDDNCDVTLEYDYKDQR